MKHAPTGARALPGAPFLVSVAISAFFDHPNVANPLTFTTVIPNSGEPSRSCMTVYVSISTTPSRPRMAGTRGVTIPVVEEAEPLDEVDGDGSAEVVATYRRHQGRRNFKRLLPA